MSTTTLSKKSGKGLSQGVTSELTAFFGVKPGHEEELRAACARFSDHCRDLDPKAHQKTGLRDTRHVIFNNGQQLLWTTTFETDWDPYMDDAPLIIGVEYFMDWMKHTVEAEQLVKWLNQAGGTEKLISGSAAERDQAVKEFGGGLKEIIQSVQIQAAGYFNMLADQTMPEIKKAARVQQAFQQVLDNPEAADALQHPALRPLLEQAAD